MKEIEKIIISGKKVHDVAYRPYLLAAAERHEIARFFADNIFIGETQAIEVLVAREEDKVERFISFVSEKHPENAS